MKNFGKISSYYYMHMCFSRAYCARVGGSVGTLEGKEVIHLKFDASLADNLSVALLAGDVAYRPKYT